MMSKINQNLTVREFMVSNLSEDAVKKWREIGTPSQTFSDFFFNIVPTRERKEICLRILQEIGIETSSVDIASHFCVRMIDRFSEENFEDFCWKIKNLAEAALRHGAEISSDAGLNVVVARGKQFPLPGLVTVYQDNSCKAKSGIFFGKVKIKKTKQFARFYDVQKFSSVIRSR